MMKAMPRERYSGGCVVCGHSCRDPRYFVPGMFGIMVHQCPKRVTGGIDAANHAAEDDNNYMLEQGKEYGQRLADGFWWMTEAER